MVELPQLTDYVRLIIELFGRFRQERSASVGAKLGRPFRYSEKSFVIFFMLMQYRRIYASKSQWRWLHKHPEVVEMLGWEQIPHCTTIGRRCNRLYDLLQLFVLFVGQDRSGLAEQLDQSHLVEDKSLFKARGPVWHERMRKAGRIPPQLRNLEQERLSWLDLRLRTAYDLQSRCSSCHAAGGDGRCLREPGSGPKGRPDSQPTAAPDSRG